MLRFLGRPGSPTSGQEASQYPLQGSKLRNDVYHRAGRFLFMAVHLGMQPSKGGDVIRNGITECAIPMTLYTAVPHVTQGAKLFKAKVVTT